MRTWILLDCTYLCYRAHFSTGGLKNRGDPSGVIYGFLRDLNSLSMRFNSERFVFCFDHGKGLRKIAYPFYKAKRPTMEEEEKENLEKQMADLKLKHLTEIGYRNVFFQNGYEADDLIASVARDLQNSDEDESIIVSGDADMYQLLSENTIIYHPQKDSIVDASSFVKEYNIPAMNWSGVKTIGGCSSDNVPGLKGVGEKTAIQYFQGKLNEKPVYQTIKDFLQSKDGFASHALVHLPYPGTKVFDLMNDKVDKRKYRQLLSDYGITTLGGK